MAEPPALLNFTTAPRWPALGLFTTLTPSSSITTSAVLARAGTAIDIRAGDDAVAVSPAVARPDSATIQSMSANSGKRQIETRPMENRRLVAGAAVNGRLVIAAELIGSPPPPGAA